MICEKIIYNDKCILTIYHSGFSDEKDMPTRNIAKDLNEASIQFLEYYEPSQNCFVGCKCIDEGFLDVQSKNNPYKGGSNCAFYKRFLGDFPESIFEINGDKIITKLTFDELENIIDFIKKFTGLDVSHDLSLFGSILYYEPRMVIIKTTKNDCLEISELDDNMILCISFYNKYTVVYSTILKTDKTNKTVTITPPEDWGYADIAIYKKGKLYYKDAYVSFIKNLVLNVNLYSTNKILLKNFKTESTVKKSYVEEHFSYNNHESNETECSLESIQNMFNLHLKKKKIVFFEPGEVGRVLSELTDILSNADEELWIVDSYFADTKSIGLSQDILNLVYNCKSNLKVIAFFSKEVDYIDNLNRSLFNDEDIQRVLKYSRLNIVFKQTKKPLHDRFIIIKNKEKIVVYVIGTSLNSIDDNYFCIVQLDEPDSLVIYNRLKKLLLDNNFCLTKEY